MFHFDLNKKESWRNIACDRLISSVFYDLAICTFATEPLDNNWELHDMWYSFCHEKHLHFQLNDGHAMLKLLQLKHNFIGFHQLNWFWFIYIQRQKMINNVKIWTFLMLSCKNSCMHARDLCILSVTCMLFSIDFWVMHE